MRQLSLLIATFAILPVTCTYAGHLSHEQHEQTIAILLNSKHHPFINSDDTEMLQITAQANIKKTSERRNRAHTPKGVLEPTPQSPSNISPQFIYTLVPSKKERCAPTDAQLGIMIDKIWAHMLEASDTDFSITPEMIRTGLQSTMEDLEQELKSSEIKIINRGLTQRLPEIHPTAQELAEIAFDILTRADEIRKDGYDPDRFLVREHTKLQQSLTPQKFYVFQNIHADMVRHLNNRKIYQ